jgi:flagellar hook-length control protein FliK
MPEAALPGTPSSVVSQGTGPLMGAVSAMTPDGGSPMDSRDQSSAFSSGAYGPAGSRLASPPAPSAVATFASMVTALPSAEGLPPETTTQIVQSIRMQMLRDGGEAHIRLDPRQFGDMSVRIRVDQGQVTARVEADAPVVREWLQNNQHLLRQSLAGQQLTLDRLEVHEPPPSSDQGRREGTSQREQDASQQRQRRRRPDTGELFEVVA